MEVRLLRCDAVDVVGVVKIDRLVERLSCRCG